MPRWKRRVVFGLAVLAHAAGARAGDLTPPAAPSTTMKTLDEVEPRIPIGPLTTPGDADSVFRISQPGSYYLTDDLVGVPSKSGIEIAASGVSVDLMGFTLEGAAGSREGVYASVASSAIAVQNGVIRGWGFEGVDLHLADGARLYGLIVEGNVQQGVFVGEATVIIECIALGNGSNGFLTSDNAFVRDCVAEGNGSSGFVTGSASQIMGVTAKDNGIHGVTIGAGSCVVSSIAYNNDGDGFVGSISVSVIDCTAAFNGQDGVDVTIGCIVRGNTVYSSTEDGVEVTSDCLVIGNKIDNAGNGGDGSGIYVTSTDNHIEGNSITDSDIGIEAATSFNLIIRNTLRNNLTAFDLAIDNRVGPIISVPSSGVVSGTAGAAGVGTTDPWANLVY